MTIITLLIGLWWPIYIYITNPGHSAFVALKESAAWINRDTKPFYHYWSFPVQSGIWTFLATCGLVFPYARNRINRIGHYWFIAGWIWIAIILLSLFPEKKERYLLPVLIPLSILTAGYVCYLIDAFNKAANSKSDTILLWFNGILMSLISTAIPVSTLIMLNKKEEPGILFYIILFAVFLSFALLFIVALLKKKPYLIWKGMIGLVMSSCLLLLPVIPKMMHTNPGYRSYKQLRYQADLKNISFYFNGEIPGKFIEVVWNCGHEVKSWNPLINRNLPVAPPLILMSHVQPFFIIDTKILSNYDVEIIGHFDGNLEIKRGNAVLSNYVTIIRQRNNK